LAGISSISFFPHQPIRYHDEEIEKRSKMLPWIVQNIEVMIRQENKIFVTIKYLLSRSSKILHRVLFNSNIFIFFIIVFFVKYIKTSKYEKHGQLFIMDYQ